MDQKRGHAKGRARGRARGHTMEGENAGQIQAPGRIRDSNIAQAEAAMGAMSISGSGNGSGNGNEARLGRGVDRGRREVAQIVWTKPSSVADKRGTSGMQIDLLANYFCIQKSRDWLLCLYHVDFNPDEDRTGTRKYLLRQHEKVLGKGFLFDGMQLYMAKKMNDMELTSKDEKTGNMFQIKVRFIKEISPFDGHFIQVMNILLKRCQDHLNLQLMGRNYYNPQKEIREDRYGIKIWPGFSTAIRQFEQNIMLNVDVTHKFLRNQDVLSHLKEKRGNFNQLLGTIVLTSYNNKTYRIDDFDLKKNPRDTFPFKGGEKSYADYYKEKYNIQIRDHTQPLILSKPKKRDIRRGMTENIYLIPELCILTGLSDEMRADFNTMRGLASYMRMAPDRRVESLMRFNADLASNAKVREELQHWGLKLEPNLLKVKGRVFEPVKISMAGQELQYESHKADWSRAMRDMKMTTPIELVNWACVFPGRMQDAAENLVRTLARVAQPMGMRVGHPVMMGLRSDTINDYINQLRGCAGKQLVLVILTNNRLDRYGAIKKFLSCQLAVPSQCVLIRTASNNKLMSIATKIAIQMNCKLGGDIWRVQIPLKNAMVIGYDTYHDSLKKGASYGAVVSSTNPAMTQFFGQVSRHESQEELTDNFAVCVRRSLEAYISRNEAPPKQVFVFRDGVGDGQIAYVKEHEVEAIKRCMDFCGDAKPLLAFIIVSKRINTRFLSTRGSQVGNPGPGTVVDEVVTLPERYDFFLVSQHVGQGTVSPTSYNVIDDNTKMKPDHLQQFSHRLCHLYYNWQGTVRVPAPCLYAHKLAYLTGTAIHDQPHESLSDKLWYI